MDFMAIKLASLVKNPPDKSAIMRRKISEDDVDYISDHNYPFIQLINPEAEFGKEFSLHFITTSNGWIVHDYGGAISTSAPHTKDGNKACSVPDQIKVAKEIAKMINWPSVELIAGTPMMEFLLWVELQLELIGYEPSEKARKRRRFLIEHGFAVEPPKGPTLTTAR
jgi:hypothetical protein